MSRPGPAGPDDRTLVRAWKLKTLDGLFVQQVADELGVSHATAKRYIKAGRDVVAELEYLDTQRQHLDRHPIRVDGAAVMDMVRGWLVQAVNDGADVFRAAELVIKAEERKARLLGEAQRVELGRAPDTLPVADDETRLAIEGYRGGAR